MKHLSKAAICSVLTILLGTSVISASAAEAKKTSTPAATPTAETLPTLDPKAAAPSTPQWQYATRPAIAGGVNPFNRLLKVAKIPHQPPSEDDIHDATNEGTLLLQKPLDAYEGMPQTESGLGNGVDWVKMLDNGDIKPRWEKTNPDAEPMVMDMNIVRVPKSSMPDVVFPHRQHTLWLACSNCHPDIFIPRKGANQINMAAIILGTKCGVCHGKVSFPVSECKRCHSQPKTVAVNGGGPK
jgi:c(7)-type cytochrome triheme protein